MSRTHRLAVAAALAFLVPAVASAQQSSLQLNIGAGVALPTGSFGDVNNAGYNLIVGIGTQAPGSQLALRAEGIYTEYGVQNTDRKSHAGGITGNLVYDLTAGNRSTTNSLYVIGGIGWYQTKEEFRLASPPSENNIGWNVGGGFRFPLSGFSAYLEARYHTVSNTDVKFVPITFGLLF